MIHLAKMSNSLVTKSVVVFNVVGFSQNKGNSLKTVTKRWYFCFCLLFVCFMQVSNRGCNCLCYEVIFSASWSPCICRQQGLCHIKSMWTEHRLFGQVLPRPQNPKWVKCPTWMFVILLKSLNIYCVCVCVYIKKSWLCNDSTRLLYLHYSGKALVAVGEH